MDASELIPLEKVPDVRAEFRRLLEDRTAKGTDSRRRFAPRLESWEKMSDQELKNRLEDSQKTQKILNMQADLLQQDRPPNANDQIRLKELGSTATSATTERVLRKYEVRLIQWVARPRSSTLSPNGGGLLNSGTS